MTHTFLNKLLRNKIEKEMDKFRIVEFAFKEIKTATVSLLLFGELPMPRNLSPNISPRKLSMASFSAKLLKTRRPLKC